MSSGPGAAPDGPAGPLPILRVVATWRLRLNRRREGLRACPWPWSATHQRAVRGLRGPEGGAQTEPGDPAPGLGLWYSRSVLRSPDLRSSWSPRTGPPGPQPDLPGPTDLGRTPGGQSVHPSRAPRGPGLGCCVGTWVGAGCWAPHPSLRQLGPGERRPWCPNFFTRECRVQGRVVAPGERGAGGGRGASATRSTPCAPGRRLGCLSSQRT